jgi:hypothetical protein
MLRWAVLLASLLTLALPAIATANTCTATGSDWANPAHWSGCPAGEVPNGDDDVIIPSPFTVNVNTADATANSVDLQSGATLSVWDAHTLAIDGGAPSTFAGTVEVLDAGSILRLAGSTTWSSGSWGAGGERGGTTANDPGGRIENAGALAMPNAVTASNPGGGRIVNLATGTVLSTADSNLVVAFENDGQVTVGAGTLTLPIGIDESSGDYAISDAAATLTLGNTHVISLTGGVTGPGTLRLNPGALILDVDAAYSPGTTMIAGGQLALGGSGTTGRLTTTGVGGGSRGAGTLAVGDGASNLEGVFFAGGGTTTFGSGATIAATGPVEVLDEGTVVRLAGTTTWSAGNWAIGGERFIANEPGGTVENAGVLNVTGNTTASNSGAGALANLAGAQLNRTTSAGTATLNPPLSNAGSLNVASGTLGANVTQTSGTTTVTGTLGGNLAAQGGTVTGTGTISGLLSNTGGIVRPGTSPGTLSVGDFTQGPDGQLLLDVDGPAAGTGFDRLEVSDAAILDGSVGVLAGFQPAIGSTFTFLTAATVTGTFASLTVDGLDSDRRMTLDYPPGSARLVVGDPPPPANTSPPVITGTPAVGQTLTCQPGTWTNSPSFAFQWLRDGSPIAGAGDQTYVPVAADAGHQLRCRVTATNTGGSATADSNTVSVPVTPVDPTPTPTPQPTPTPAPTVQPTSNRPAATPQEVRLDNASANQVAAAFGLPSARRCVSRRNFTIRLRRPRGVTIDRARVRVNKKRVRVRRVRGRFTARVDLRGFPKGRFTVRIRIFTESGRTLDGRRRYRTCAPRLG